MNDKVVRAAKRVLPIYRKTVDGWAQGVVEGSQDGSRKVSCEKGCDGCCYNLVKATLAEGAALAAHLIEKGTFERFRPKLERSAKTADSVEDDEDVSFKYLSTKTPCAFLEDGECSVYDLRPAACRTYFVVSDPALCSPDRPGAAVGYVDQSAVVGIFIAELVKGTHPAIPSYIGSLPAVVLAGKELIERSPGSFKRWASKSPLFTAGKTEGAA